MSRLIKKIVHFLLRVEREADAEFIAMDDIQRREIINFINGGTM